jgi:hypothetical protein
MRVAETRAVNRALRKAYGIGLCPLLSQAKWKRKDRLQQPQPPAMANLACVIASASSSANTNSILPWSNATQRTSVGPRPFGELAGTSLKPSSPTWPIGPPRIDPVSCAI